MSVSAVKENQSHNAIIIWLTMVCAMVVLMVVVGGITRLTGSGLSMVDWRPIMGVLPPISEVEWNTVFLAYQQFPEFQQINKSITLEEFKGIFYWEYGHRVLGRLIGLAFFLPFLAFVIMGKVRGSLAIKLSIGLFLGGLQGLMGWYMVKGGLVDIPRVSHYRLAAHLLLAMLILCYLCWLIFELREKQSRVFCSPLFSKLVYGLAGASVLQILYGAFTAGSRAGYGYNTYPLMNESWIAEAVFYLDPWWLNLFENTATIQFMHRWLGALVLLLALAVFFVSYLDDALKDLRKYTMTLMVVISAQFLLGVFTLVQVVPIGLASMHQFGACVLLIALVRTLYIVKTSR